MNKIKYFLGGIFYLILSICIAAVLVLNSTFIYQKCISAYKLGEQTSLKASQILRDYKEIISYINNPRLDTIHFKYFTLSKNGMSHFKDVKNIFLFIYSFIIISVVILLILYIAAKIKRRKLKLTSLNYFFYSSIVLIGALMVFVICDFSTLFRLFHKVAFTNDYWIFDEVNDSIINVLPKDFFLLCLILILAIVLALSIGAKIIYTIKEKTGKNMTIR